MSESVTCPKCEKTSYHPGDVRNRYCAVCGYHDAPKDALHGVPGVSAKFRQPTPAMQAQAMLMGFEGVFHNWVEGITSDLDLKVAFKRYREDMLELAPHLERGEWIQPRKYPPPPRGGGIL